jgi:hypothetical protein
MMIGTPGRAALAWGNSSSPLIPGILMSDRIRMSDRSPASWGGLGKLHGEPASAKVAPELLPEQHFDIRLIIDHENEHVHARSPDLIRDTPVRAKTILNSVNTPGCVLSRDRDQRGWQKHDVNAAYLSAWSASTSAASG